MALWLITNGWQGNGQEAVILEAPSEEAALDQAEAAFTDKANQDLAKAQGRRSGPPEWQVKHHAEQIASYRERGAWRITEITLPFLTEVS